MASTKEGKIAVVTGGANGIGRSICRQLALDGFSVAILDRDGDSALAQIEQLQELGADGAAFLCDLSQPEQIQAAFDQVMARFGRIDALVNNAGVGGYLSWMEMSMEQWHRFTRVNCDAPFLCIQRTAQEMVRQNIQGRIVIVLSQAAMNQDEDIVTPYGTSKWCARWLMRSAAAALKPYGILVNGVCPGTVWTPMMERFCQEYVASGSGTREDYLKFIQGLYPTGRLQTGEDIAAACSFLIQHSGRITGQSLLVAGGIVSV